MYLGTMTRQQIENLTDKDVAAAKAKHGAKTTIEFVLTQVSASRPLEAAKGHLLSILAKNSK